MDNSTSSLAAPAAIPPPDITSNFMSVNNRAGVLVVVSTVCLFFMVILHVQRMLVKIRTNHRWGLDDCCCTLGKLGAIGYAAVCLSTIQSGIGLHQWDLPASAFTPLLLKKLYAIQILIPATFLMIKLSLLMLYHHVFHPKKLLKHLIFLGIFVNTLVYSAFIGAQIVVWTPASGHPWFSTATSAGSATTIWLGVAQSGFNVLSDFYLLILPFGGLFYLQLPLRKKIGVGAIFMTGALACASSILTLVYRIKLLGDDDTTWDLSYVFILSIVETTVGIMCSCMPALASFFRIHTPLFQSLLSFFGSSSKRSDRSDPKKESAGSDTSDGRYEDSGASRQPSWPLENPRTIAASRLGELEFEKSARLESRDLGREEATVGR